MSSSALDLAAAASKITNVVQIRAAMGAVTTTLAQGYAQLASITTTEGVQQAATDLLNTVNASATALYGKYTDEADLQDEDISVWNAHLAAVVISEANDALTDVEQAANLNLWDIAAIVEQALTLVGAAVGSGLQSITNAVVAGASAFAWASWPTLLLVGAGVIAYYNRDKIFKAIGKSAGGVL
jgi:hypothetical protein